MIAAIIQARTGSSRLPNKVFRELCGKPLIWHVFDRIKFSKKIDKFILATTVNSNDDILEKWAVDNDILCFRGSEDDVLDRYYQSARYFSVNSILRITADDPFKDPDIIDNVINLFEKEKLDFAYNNNPPSFPEGLDTEIFSFTALEKACFNSTDSFEREHVTQYFYRHPEIFTQKNYSFIKDLSHLRWTIDNAEDFSMVNEVYNFLYEKGKIFKFHNILKLLDEKPYLAKININVIRSGMYNNNQINE